MGSNEGMQKIQTFFTKTFAKKTLTRGKLLGGACP